MSSHSNYWNCPNVQPPFTSRFCPRHVIFVHSTLTSRRFFSNHRSGHVFAHVNAFAHVESLSLTLLAHLAVLNMYFVFTSTVRVCLALFHGDGCWVLLSKILYFRPLCPRGRFVIQICQQDESNTQDGDDREKE